MVREQRDLMEGVESDGGPMEECGKRFRKEGDEVIGVAIESKKVCVITDVREKQIMNSKTIKTDTRIAWFTNLATSTAERKRIFY